MRAAHLAELHDRALAELFLERGKKIVQILRTPFFLLFFFYFFHLLFFFRRVRFGLSLFYWCHGLIIPEEALKTH